MARMGRALAYRPINSLKHVVDTSGVVIGGAQSVTDIAVQHDDPLTSVSNRITTGGVVKSIYLRVEVAGAIAYAGVPRVYMFVFKNPGSEVSVPPVDAVGIDKARKFVIHQEMQMQAQQTTSGAGGGDGTFPRTLFKGVILIPRKYQRFGDGDKLQFVIGNDTGESTGSTQWCLQCIYKEFM